MAKEKDIFVSNQHTAAIILPRIYAPNPSGDPSQAQLRVESRVIQSGHTECFSATEWELRKAIASVQYYLDHGHLAVVKRAGAADVVTDETVDLQIPEHLQVDQDGAVSVDSKADPSVKVKADIRSAKKGTANIG